MNSTQLVGRITKDLELKATPNGKYVCEFNLAVNRFKEGTDFITCQVWGTQAENIVKYQGKGSQIAVIGSLRVDTFDDKDGKKRYKTYVLANSIEYLGSKQTSEQVSEQPTQEVKKEPDPFKEFSEEIQLTDDELPF